MSQTILLAEDHKIVREGLRSLLDQHDDLEVIGEAEDGRTAADLARQLRPNVVIMDISMPGLNGIEATRQIVAQSAGVKVIALSVHADAKFVASMLKAGATGYVLKECAFEELEDAIDAVRSNRIYLSKRITSVVVESYVSRLSAADHSAPPALTAKEREVLQLMAEGKATKEVARILHISVKTVETHRKHIMDRLNLRSIAELTKYAVREGLTSLDD